MANPLVRTIFPINGAVFTEEVAALGMSVNMEYFNGDEDSGNFEFYFDGDPTSGDETLFDGAIAAHDSSDFTAPPFLDVSESESSDDSGVPIVKVHLDDIMPMPGDYTLYWYMEIMTTTTTGSSGARGILNVTKNGSKVERARHHNSENQERNMSGAFPFTVTAGEVYSFELTFERIGASGNAARAQRARLAVKKDN